MDGDRKYSQRGYQENGRDRRNGESGHQERQKPQGPRPPIDITGPKLPRLVQAVAASRCFSCAITLPPGFSHHDPCPKCGVQLHCCKQCAYFEPSTRFQCLKPIPLRIVVKDQKNECTLFAPRVTVARDSATTNGSGAGSGRSAVAGILAAPPRNPSDAKDAFERLFKK